MRANEYSEAIAAYSRSLELDQDHATTLCNRAMAYLRAQDYSNCIKDANKAIRLEPNYVKAYHRRGKAHLAKKNWRQAVEDFETVLDRSLGELVDNVDIKDCLKVAREKLAQQRNVSSSSCGGESQSQKWSGSSNSSHSSSSYDSTPSYDDEEDDQTDHRKKPTRRARPLGHAIEETLDSHSQHYVVEDKEDEEEVQQKKRDDSQDDKQQAKSAQFVFDFEQIMRSSAQIKQNRVNMARRRREQQKRERQGDNDDNEKYASLYPKDMDENSEQCRKVKDESEIEPEPTASK